MTQLLIQVTAILAQGPLFDRGDVIVSSDQVIPKHVIDGWQIVDAALPAGFTCAGYTWTGTAIAAKPPVIDTVAIKAAIQSQIDTLERGAMLNRGSRELELRLMEDKAQSLATARSVPVADILAGTPYYVKLKTLDDQITALRVQL